jgi:hypothetical protein
VKSCQTERPTLPEARAADRGSPRNLSVSLRWRGRCDGDEEGESGLCGHSVVTVVQPVDL